MVGPLQPTRVDGFVVGLRAWRLQGYRLASAGVYDGAFWNIGDTTARCLWEYFGANWAHPTDAPPGHTSPHPLCACGLYAYHPDIPIEWRAGARTWAVFGLVQAWGQLEVHEIGFRAQYARPVLLAVERESMPADAVRHVELVAAEFELDVVALDELPAHAVRFGRVVPRELRPRAHPGYAIEQISAAVISTLPPRPSCFRRLLRCYCLAAGALNLFFGFTTGSWFNLASGLIALATAAWAWHD